MDKFREYRSETYDEIVLKHVNIAEQRIKELFFDGKIPEDLRKEMKMWDKLSGDLVE